MTSTLGNGYKTFMLLGRFMQFYPNSPIFIYSHRLFYSHQDALLGKREGKGRKALTAKGPRRGSAGGLSGAGALILRLEFRILERN